MDTVTAISERRLEAVPTPGTPAATRTLTVTATYLLSEDGRKASLLDGGDGKAVQHLSLQVPANRLHLVTVDAKGVARLKLRPRYQLDGDNGIARVDTAPTYDSPPDVEELFREAARNHQLERAYHSERQATKIKRREADHERRTIVAKAFLSEDWKTPTIGDSLRLINGRAFKPEDWKERGLPIVRIQNLNDSESSFNYWPGPVEERHRIQAGDLLFAWSGTTGTSFGARVWNGPAGVLNQHIFKVIPNQQKLTLRYALLVLRRVQDHIEKQAHGFKASFVHVKKTDLVGVQLPLPPTKAEQDAIADVLGDTDALIESLEQLVAKRRQIRQGAMQELLAGRKRLPGFTGEWAVKRLGEIGATFGGLSGKTKRDFGHGAARYITFMNIMTNVVIDCDAFESVDIKPMESQNRVAKGDLFFNGSSETPKEVGMCAVLVQHVTDVSLNSFCFGFRFHEDAPADGLYFAYFFRSQEGRKLLRSLAQGATRYNLSKTALLRVEFPLPKPLEQRAIASVLSDMDAEIAALETKVAKARQLKQGMMQELLTGRTRLV